ncbi:MAG: response regulator transcription factor [Sedimentisphaerales bacterium]|nr:response regulator transcription factor [Sedimentisphaerales bacterium]
MSTKILLADNHKILCEGLRSLIHSESDMEVIGEADNGQAAVEQARELNPDVVVMDINMPVLDGIEATRIILKENPNIKVVALSINSSKQYIWGMLQAGASSYILKENAFEDLIKAIQSVVNGDTYFSAEVTGLAKKASKGKTAGKPKSILNDREMAVLKMLADGKSSKEIALELNRSPKTVDACRRQILRKLKIETMADLIKYAVREGLTSL